MKLAVATVAAGLAILCAAHSAAAPNPEAVGMSRERLARIDAMRNIVSARMGWRVSRLMTP